MQDLQTESRVFYSQGPLAHCVSNTTTIQPQLQPLYRNCPIRCSNKLVTLGVVYSSSRTVTVNGCLWDDAGERTNDYSLDELYRTLEKWLHSYCMVREALLSKHQRRKAVHEVLNKASSTRLTRQYNIYCAFHAVLFGRSIAPRGKAMGFKTSLRTNF